MQRALDPYDALKVRAYYRPPLPPPGEKPEAVGFELKGCPHRLSDYDGVYRAQNDDFLNDALPWPAAQAWREARAGFPVFKNAHGKLCYHVREPRHDERDTGAWRFSAPQDVANIFTGGFTDICIDAVEWIGADACTLPVGANTFSIATRPDTGSDESQDDDDGEGDILDECELEVTMLRTEAEVLEAERRIRAEAARKHALGCSPDLVSAVMIDGHPDPAYNGRYAISETGFRHRRALVNEHGNTCRRQKLEGARQQWTLQPRDQDRYVAWIDSPDGPLPTGAHTWECWDPGLGVLVPGSGPTIHGGWAQHTLTVTIEHK